ncbi:MAG: hydrogenase nickel incorporation protein HypB [Bdellovibrionia bacterium]
MCTTCGCSKDAKATITKFKGTKSLLLKPAGSFALKPVEDPNRVHLEIKILAKNDEIAAKNRSYFQTHQILALNLMSSPGSGKTTLLERTIRELKGQLLIQVIEGDQETTNDAERIRATGCPVVQINTGAGCHLEAKMLSEGISALAPSNNSIVMIENVGNLVCPSLFDLGEKAKVVILSVTEGEDKPLKYPYMFKNADLMILNKIDLLPYVQFDMAKCVEYARQVNPKLRIIKLSATKGEGVDERYSWLRKEGSSLGIVPIKNPSNRPGTHLWTNL